MRCSVGWRPKMGRDLIGEILVEESPFKFSKEFLKKVRKEAWLTQGAAARLIRVPFSTYTAWEYGRNDMPTPIWCYFQIQAKKYKELVYANLGKGKKEGEWIDE